MSEPNNHKASYLDEAKKPLRVGSFTTPSPEAHEVLIRNKAVAINPVDWKIQDYGIFIQKWPAILGEDVAGVIEAVGDKVTRFKTGQRVLAHSQYLATGKAEQSGFQELSIAPETVVSPIPDSMKFEEATVLPLALSTAAAGLYMKDFLGLQYPTLESKSNGKTLLVWGGSSSVGCVAVQLAVASGYSVITTCSKRNFDFCKALGASVFDYNSLSIVGDLVAELQKGDFVGAYDAIGTRESEMQTAQVVTQFGGGKIATVLPPPEDIPANVNSKGVFAPGIFNAEAAVGKAVYEDFLPKALESGQIKAKPDPEVTGHGLEALQAAFDKQKAGVSAKKIVVTL